jgi:hypothetical protein
LKPRESAANRPSLHLGVFLDGSWVAVPHDRSEDSVVGPLALQMRGSQVLRAHVKANGCNALRAKQSKRILGEIRSWLMTQRALPRSALGKAIAYTSSLWPGLVRFLGDPKIPLDTNGVERALRGVAVGPKNHYGSRSKRGARVAALLYSLIESAKLCGVEPRAYLGEAARRAIRNAGTVTLARDFK